MVIPAMSSLVKMQSAFSLTQQNVWHKVEKAHTQIPDNIATIKGTKKD